jgi:SAM-dependent methyltransferase
VRDRSFDLPGRFSLVRCSNCSLVRLSPRPDSASLPLYYPAEQYEAHRPAGVVKPGRERVGGARRVVRGVVLQSLGYEIDGLPPWTRWMPRRFPRRLVRQAAYGWEGFPARVRRGRALDVGCGNGRFLERLRHHGWDVAGVDTSPAAARAAREALGVDVRVGTLESASFEQGSFEFVHMSHVLEHLPDPLATLREVARLVAPGGRVYIETPNIDSLGFRWTGEFWFPLEAPRHLWLFSPRTLARALSSVGLSVSQLHARSFPVFKWEAIYREEERTGQRGRPGPATRARALPRALVLRPAITIASRFSPRFGDITCCWAELPADAG